MKNVGIHINNENKCQLMYIPTFCMELSRLDIFKQRIRKLWHSIKRRRRYLQHLIAEGTGKKNSEYRTDLIRQSLDKGDIVRIKSKEEIWATLDRWGLLKGCGMMDHMWQLCGTTQRVLKRIDQFVDERNYKLKKCKGMVALENVLCIGTKDFGICDRSCFFFWREEWLEKIDDEEAASLQNINTLNIQNKTIFDRELVRIRSRQEIEATLDFDLQLHGCKFLEEMWKYCGTTQSVFRNVSRILDERDYLAKNCKGLMILEGLICDGTKSIGRCDRSCFYFWRIEWLEKL